MLGTSSQILRPLKGNRRFKFAVMDVESTKWVNLKMIGFFDGEAYSWYATPKDFLVNFLRKKYRGYRCFAHYGSGFDFAFLFDSLARDFPDFGFEILSNNGASMIRVKDTMEKDSRGRQKYKSSWYFLDSFRLLPKGLEDLTNSFDVEHKKMANVDRTNIGKIPLPKLVKYNEYDCRGLYEVLKKFEHWFDDYEVPLKPTTASQAMTVFRKMLKFGIPVLKNNVESFVRKGYYGGRTEVFKMRCFDHFYYYDVRSLYPYCMKKYPMPVGTARQVSRMHDGAVGFYKANISVPSMYIPGLPFVKDQKLIFPCGNISGVYSSIELEKAAESGCDIAIDYGYEFPDAFIFDKYVDAMYKFKESPDLTTKLIGKLLLNSCYGKFGQNRRKTSIIRSQPGRSPGLAPYNEEYGLYEKDSVSQATFIIPSIAAWITSCARSELFGWLLKSGEKDVYYCDTDSVCSTKKLPTGNRLGDLKLEMEGEEGIFLSPKLYVIKKNDGLVAKAKGFEHEFVNKLSFESFDRALHGNKQDFVQEVQRFAKFKEALVREGKFVTMLTKKKSIQSDYSKRQVLPNFDTKPLKVSC